MDRLRDNGRDILNEASELAKLSGVEVESVLRESAERRVSDVILDEAKTWPADLIVMGTHGRRGVGHLAMRRGA